MADVTVASVMTTRLVTVQPDAPLRELVSVLAEGRVSAVPVVDRHGQPVGVVSTAQLAAGREFDGGPRGDGRRTAAELMTTPVRAVHADEPVTFVAQVLAKAGVRRLFVVNRDSRLVGVVARRDLLRVYLGGDDQLRTQVVELLAAAGLAPAGVEVRVDAGVVTVDGEVERHSVAGKIVRLVRTLPDVVDVRDNLRCAVGVGMTQHGLTARPKTMFKQLVRL